MSEESHAAAVIAALTTATANPFDLDDAKRATDADLGAAYTEVLVTRRYGGAERQDGSTTRSGWRISTRAIGRTVTNARTMRDRAQEALKYVRLSIDGDLTSPIAFESEDPIGEDDGWYSGLTTWTYGT